eukprot:TRINITY_DN5608_c0_g1_i1.p1 TRINITY_DN5608_c0_g1~~TRINITY_DN5608_c0_g1_i1.p1  ORF type:complete len:316 (+),score=46.94 TRINITY_DN5608_c0_g1_i1:205-1152(+)
MESMSSSSTSNFLGTISWSLSPIVSSLYRCDVPLFPTASDRVIEQIRGLDPETALNGTFFTMFCFIGLCHLLPQWIARKQSNPYTMQIQWNFGLDSFNFQMLNYDVYHASAVCRWTHHITLSVEAFLWLAVLRGTFGSFALFATLGLLCIQASSFGDRTFELSLIAAWTCFAVLVQIIYCSQIFDIAALLFLAKKAIFCSVVMRTTSHILEATPPLVNGDNDKFGVVAFYFALTNPYRSLLAFVFGVISEMASGIPGRLFPVVFYHLLSNGGYKSRVLVNIGDSRDIGDHILSKGWSAYPLTSRLFSWARGNPAA